MLVLLGVRVRLADVNGLCHNAAILWLVQVVVRDRAERLAIEMAAREGGSRWSPVGVTQQVTTEAANTDALEQIETQLISLLQVVRGLRGTEAVALPKQAASDEMLSVDAAARRMRMAKATAIQWLYDTGLVRIVGPDDTRFVLWSEVVRALTQTPTIHRHGTERDPPRSVPVLSDRNPSLPQRRTPSRSTMNRKIREGDAWLME